MKVTLTRFGAEEVEIDPQSIITFPEGISPFDDCKRYKLFHEEGQTRARIFWLQSLDEPDLMFSVSDPALLRMAYEVALTDEEQALLQVDSGDDLVLAVILYRDEKSEGGINMITSGPIVINANKRIGMQKMLKEFGAQVVIQGT